MENCVIYTRVSTKEQAETNNSLEWQSKHCVAYAVKQNLRVLGQFGGTYESAKSDERKEFNRMLKFVKGSREQISVILVYSIDRFSRTGDSAIYIASELQKTGVRIVAVSQPIDTTSHAGALQQNIQFIFSKYDNDLRRQKTIDGMREKLLRGEWIGHCPKGYTNVKGTLTQTIVINEFGPLIKCAFEWRAKGETYQQIVDKLRARGMILPVQTLTDIFRNPFYCGFMAHSLLRGELVKGKHPALIEEALFLSVQEEKMSDGYKITKSNDELPLKGFVRDAGSGVNFTGYLVRKKGLYYYKANRVGLCLNRSAEKMHEQFRELLVQYTLRPEFVEPLKRQLVYTYEYLTESSQKGRTSLSVRIHDLDLKIHALRKRHALGEVSLDVYEEFHRELSDQKEELAREHAQLEKGLSNPIELLEFSCLTATNLTLAWDTGGYHEKQTLQWMLFPSGLVYDAQKNDYRTPEVNTVFAAIADQSRVLEETKSGTSSKKGKKSRSVPGAGIEPALPQWQQDFKSCVSTSSTTRATD